MLRYNFPPGHVVIMIMTMWQPSVACLAFDMQHIYTNAQEYLGKHPEVLGIPLLLSPQRGLIGLLKFLNDNLSKPDQSIWKGMLWQTQTVFLPRPRGLQFLQLKADSQDGSSLQFPRKAPENDRTTAKKKPQCINPSRRVVQSSRAWAARGVCSLFHDWGKHSAGEGKKTTTKTTDSPGLMFPQVSAKCLRRQSSVSTAVCVCACVCVFFCPLVLSCGAGKLGMGFWF